jgi:tetratricopeptide (TPR) repeat protein
MGKNQPLKGKKLIIFGVLFTVFMAFIGYKMLFNTTDHAFINRELEKDKALSQFDKGLEFYDQKKYVEAGKYFEESINNGFPVAHALLGECKLHLNDLKSAQYHLLKALAVENGENELVGYYSGVEYNLGMVYYMQKDTKNAILHLQKAEQLGNKDAAIYLSKMR